MASLYQKRRNQRNQAKHPKTNQPTYRPRLEALEDRLLLSAPALLYSYSMATGMNWGVAVDASQNVYMAGQGGLAGKLDSTGTSFQFLSYLTAAVAPVRPSPSIVRGTFTSRASQVPTSRLRRMPSAPVPAINF